MEKDSLRGHFEELLTNRTGEYKMYPTERVWNSIYQRLHSRRKWHFIGGGTFALMILGGVFVLMQDNTRSALPALSRISPAASPAGPKAADQSARLTKPSGTQGNSVDMPPNDLLIPGAPGKSLLSSLGSGRPDYALFRNPVMDAGHMPVAELPGSMALPESADAESTVKAVSLEKTGNEPLLLNKDLKEAAPAVSFAPMKILKGPGRYSWQFHLTPSVSYRTLKSKTAITTTNLGIIVVDNNGYDINRLVDQRPSMGFELGTDLMYSLTSRVRLKAGLQFNYSRYSSKAVPNQPQPVTISLGGPGTGGIPPRMVTSTTSYANGAGQPNGMFTWIPDQRVELSLPVGAEYQVLRARTFSWNVAGTVQPTYVLNAKAFLLSSDYKSYAQDPNLLRTWNMNVAAETFLRFDKGDIQIQVGPQIRYQLFPSFISSYPVSEHLYDIGFKVGISRTIK